MIIEHVIIGGTKLVLHYTMNQHNRPERWEAQVTANYNKTRVHKALFFPFRIAFEKAGIKV